MLLTLFFSALVSATLWPLASEALFVLYWQQDVAPLWHLVVVAGVGNSLGAILMFELGRVSNQWLERRMASQWQRLQRTQRFLQQYGSPLLFFAWLPAIGDLLPVAAGLLKLARPTAWVWICIGKFSRYAFLAWMLSLYGAL